MKTTRKRKEKKRKREKRKELWSASSSSVAPAFSPTASTPAPVITLSTRRRRRGRSGRARAPRRVDPQRPRDDGRQPEGDRGPHGEERLIRDKGQSEARAAARQSAREPVAVVVIVVMLMLARGRRSCCCSRSRCCFPRELRRRRRPSFFCNFLLFLLPHEPPTAEKLVDFHSPLDGDVACYFVFLCVLRERGFFRRERCLVFPPLHFFLHLFLPFPLTSEPREVDRKVDPYGDFAVLAEHLARSRRVAAHFRSVARRATARERPGEKTVEVEFSPPWFSLFAPRASIACCLLRGLSRPRACLRSTRQAERDLNTSRRRLERTGEGVGVRALRC